MKKHLKLFNKFLQEAKDPSYYQETFYFTILISMNKDHGGSRDETKNDIRALPEVLTVTLVEPVKGGVQRDLGTKYLSTLKVHIRKPRDVSKQMLMKRTVLHISNLRGVAVLRYKERKPKPRKKAFHGPGSYKITEADYQKVRRQKAAEYSRDKAQYISTGPQKKGGAPFNRPASKKRGPSGPAGFGALEEMAMVTPAELPEDIVVVVAREKSLARHPAYKIYYARKGEEGEPLKSGDLDRAEREAREGRESIYGTIKIGRHVGGGPYRGVYLVTSVKAADQYGPLLYDVAMELAGNDGLKPDIDSVSDEASAVWKHYDEQRPDVESTMLVDDEHEYEDVMPPNHAELGSASKHLAKAYYWMKGSRTQELGDKLVFLDKESESDDGPLYEDILITIGQEAGDLKTFDIQTELNQKIWDEDREIRPGVKGALMDIVEEFMESLDLDIDLKDVIITGSLANYNWSKFSDIDLHLLVNFAEVNDNEKMVKKFFDAVRSRWNKMHDIFVKGHEVEIYIQNEDEEHVSTGVYSLLKDEWIVKPKLTNPSIDEKTATKKMHSMEKEIDKLSSIYDSGQYDSAYELADKLKEKLKRMRKTGLERIGIYSPENLAFKMLRRSGDIEKLFSIYTKAYDKIYSLDQ